MGESFPAPARLSRILYMSVKVLVVDDSPVARKMLIHALPKDWDIEVAQAGNGREALETYRAQGVDVMFLDLTMPEMDGFQVLEAIQRDGMNCLVIVVSADVQPIAQERVKRLGAIAFVRKPIAPAPIRTVLRDYGIFV
jgi:two-component system, chemotaxis family, chemotaxis protein CheY